MIPTSAHDSINKIDFFLFINHDLGHSFKTKPVSCLLIWNRWRKLTVSCREFEYIVCWREGRKLQEVEIDGCIKQLTEETGSWIASYRKLYCWGQLTVKRRQPVKEDAVKTSISVKNCSGRNKIGYSKEEVSLKPLSLLNTLIIPRKFTKPSVLLWKGRKGTVKTEVFCLKKKIQNDS